MPRGQFITPMASSVPWLLRDGGAAAHATPRHHPSRPGGSGGGGARWAQLNPHAYRREDTSIDEVMASRLIADPLRQRDCCLVTDAGGAFILTTAERARSAPPPVHVLGIAESFSHHYTPFNTSDWLDTNVAATADAALAMAGVTRQDIDVVQIYDHFTIGVIQSLEELGFCKRGEGGAFVAGGRLAPGGDFPSTPRAAACPTTIPGSSACCCCSSGAPVAQNAASGNCPSRAGAGARARPGVFLQYHPDSRSLTMETVQRPLPQPTRITQPYWDAAREPPGDPAVRPLQGAPVLPARILHGLPVGRPGLDRMRRQGRRVHPYTINRRGAGAPSASGCPTWSRRSTWTRACA